VYLSWLQGDLSWLQGSMMSAAPSEMMDNHGAHTHTHTHTHTSAVGTKSAQDSMPLPAGWSKKLDPKGFEFWVCDHIHTHTHTYTHTPTHTKGFVFWASDRIAYLHHPRARSLSITRACALDYILHCKHITYFVLHTSLLRTLFHTSFSITRARARPLSVSVCRARAHTHTHAYAHSLPWYLSGHSPLHPSVSLALAPLGLILSCARARARAHTHTHTLTTLVPFRALSLAPPLFLPRFPVRVSAGQPRTKDDFVHASCTYDYRGWCRRSCSRRGQRRWSRSCCLERTRGCTEPPSKYVCCPKAPTCWPRRRRQMRLGWQRERESGKGGCEGVTSKGRVCAGFVKG